MKPIFFQLFMITLMSMTLCDSAPFEENFRGKGVKNRLTEKFPGKLVNRLTSLIVNGIPAGQREFYVKVFVNGSDERVFCGGVAIADRWLLTAASCVNDIPTRLLTVQVGPFDQLDPNKAATMFTVWSMYFAPEFSLQHRPTNNLALLKIDGKFKENQTLPLCEESLDLGRLLGSCGLGSTSTRDILTATTLQEAFFYETVFENTVRRDARMCPLNNICTDTVFHGSNICVSDYGNPLYEMGCDEKVPKCLQGVASYHVEDRKHRPGEICTSGSVFTRVEILRDWIQHIIEVD